MKSLKLCIHRDLALHPPSDLRWSTRSWHSSSKCEPKRILSFSESSRKNTYSVHVDPGAEGVCPLLGGSTIVPAWRPFLPRDFFALLHTVSLLMAGHSWDHQTGPLHHTQSLPWTVRLHGCLASSSVFQEVTFSVLSYILNLHYNAVVSCTDSMDHTVSNHSLRKADVGKRQSDT